jgi:uncharacterized protein (DUF4415 family)
MKRTHILKRPAGFNPEVIDPDNPPWTEELLGPPIFRRGRGPQQSLTKLLTTLRLDPAVLEYFRAKGPGYQTRINEALREIVRRDTDPGASPSAGKKAGRSVAKVARKAAEKKLPSRATRRR